MPFYGQTPEYVRAFPALSHPASFEAMEDAVPPFNGDRIRMADCMAGTGMAGRGVSRLLHERRKLLADVTYVDGFEGMLNDRDYAAGDHRVLADVRDIQLPDGYADLVVVRCGLNNLAKADCPVAMSELLRITRDRGAVVLQDHFPIDDNERAWMDGIEQWIAMEEGRPVLPGLCTLPEIRDIVRAQRAAVTWHALNVYRFSITERMRKKNLTAVHPTEDVVVYPISTMTIRKQAA